MPKNQCYVTDFEEGRVYLFQFPRMKALPNLSPFCLKLETWLRLFDIKYKNVENLPIMHRSAEGTLPYVELNGVQYNDSAFIIRDLPEKLGIQSPEEVLSAQEKAISLAFERLVENSLFLGSGKFRYVHVDKILALWPPKFGFAQPLANFFIKKVMMSKIHDKMVATGMGKHTDDEILGIVSNDLQALSRQLGEKPFLMGDKPTKIDASVFAALALILYMPFETSVSQIVKEKFPNLQNYADRIKAKYWPDWDQFDPTAPAK